MIITQQEGWPRPQANLSCRTQKGPGYKEAIFSVCDSCPLCDPDTDSYLSSEDELETSWGQKSGSYVEEPPERKTFPTLVQVCCVCGGRVGV